MVKILYTTVVMSSHTNAGKYVLVIPWPSVDLSPLVVLMVIAMVQRIYTMLLWPLFAQPATMGAPVGS